MLFCAKLPQFPSGLAYRLQGLFHVVGAADFFVGGREIAEVADERLDGRVGVKGLEHVFLDERGDIVHGLHALGLIEQIYGLIAVHAEALFKP